MIGFIAAVTSDDGWRAGLVISAYGFGLRHGIDWDHVAVITDITNSQDDQRRSMLFATLYALGHATIVFLLGSFAILTGDLLPAGVDSAMERVVGATLLLLGGYVFFALARHGREFRMRSRYMLLFAGIARLGRRLRRGEVLVEIEHDHDHDNGHRHHPDHDHGSVGISDDQDYGLVSSHNQEHNTAGSEWRGDSPEAERLIRHRHSHRHRHCGPVPDDPFTNYGKMTSYAVGMLHGVGAETASQVLVLLAAARAGNGLGEILLVVFILGLLTSNTGIALASTVGYLNAARGFGVYAFVAVVTGTFSLAIGLLFVLGKASLLPAIFGG